MMESTMHQRFLCQLETSVPYDYAHFLHVMFCCNLVTIYLLQDNEFDYVVCKSYRYSVQAQIW